MRVLVAAAAAWVTLFAGSPALAAHGSPASGASAGSSGPSIVRTKTPAVRIVTVSQRQPRLGERVVVTGRTRVTSRAVRLQLRRRTDAGARWVTVDRARSRAGRFVLSAKVRRDAVDGLRVLAPASRRKARAASPAVRLRVQRATPRPRPDPDRTGPDRPGPDRPGPAAPVPLAPTAPPTAVGDGLATESVQGELARLVREYRATLGRTEVGSDACLAAWAADFAATMAGTHVFAHSGSSEWSAVAARPAPVTRACPAGTPVTYRQEAIARVVGATPEEVAARVLADLRSAWMHDEVLLDDAGADRVLEVGAAQDATGEWFVVVVLAAS